MVEKMKAIGFTKSLSINEKNSLVDFETEIPQANEHDLLVKICAFSVNPVDVSVRQTRQDNLKSPKVMGWDAVGVVEAVGNSASLFKSGDLVFYAGSFKRPGSNSQYQLVDERIVGHAPKNLTYAQSAAMPLTSLTAWEALFEQFAIDPYDFANNQNKTLLIINGAGGVGSIATQLAHWAGLKVIASASRPETIKWTREHGADITVNHRNDLVAEVRKYTQQKYVDYILDLSDLNAHWEEIVELIKPSGIIASITGNSQPLDLVRLKQKRAIFAWEWMFTKSFYQTDNMITQHDILEKIAELLDKGVIKSTLTRTLSPINVSNLKEAHRLVESHRMIGKVVVSNEAEK